MGVRAWVGYCISYKARVSNLFLRAGSATSHSGDAPLNLGLNLGLVFVFALNLDLILDQIWVTLALNGTACEHALCGRYEVLTPPQHNGCEEPAK